MVVVGSFSKVCVFNENDPSTRRQYHNNIVSKSFHFGDRFQKLSFWVEKIIVFDCFRADARWKREEKFAVSIKTIWKRIRVDRALTEPVSHVIIMCSISLQSWYILMFVLDFNCLLWWLWCGLTFVRSGLIFEQEDSPILLSYSQPTSLEWKAESIQLGHSDYSSGRGFSGLGVSVSIWIS